MVDDGLTDELARLAADGLTEPETLSLGAVLRRELEGKKKGRSFGQATAGEVALALLKIRAARAMQRFPTLPPSDAAAIAAAQGAILAYSQTIAEIQRVVDAADNILDLLDEMERHELAAELGLDPDHPDTPPFADQE